MKKLFKKFSSLKKWQKIFLFLLSFCLFGGVVQNYPPPKIIPDKTETDRILFIPGIKTWDFYLWGWKRDLPKKFPNAEIVFLDDIFYLHFENEKTKKIVEQGVEILSDGKPTKIIAHSFGGILARAIIDQSPNADVKEFISMASPHNMKILGVKEAKKNLQILDSFPEDIELKTFGGYLDPVVPFIWTSLNHSEHENIFSEHLGFLLFKKIRARILEAI